MLRLSAFSSEWTPVIAVEPGSYLPGRKLEDSPPGNMTSPRGRSKPMISRDPTKQSSKIVLYWGPGLVSPNHEQRDKCRRTRTPKHVRNASTLRQTEPHGRKQLEGKRMYRKKKTSRYLMITTLEKHVKILKPLN